MKHASIRSFTELWAWQKARVVRTAVRELVRAWPAEERYRLTDQIIRSSRSACANIAEGFGRYSEKDNVRFCRQAKGSLYETMDHLSVAFDEGFLDAATLKRHWALCEEALRVLNGYMNHLLRLSGEGTAAEPMATYGTAEGAIFTEAPPDLRWDDAVGENDDGDGRAPDNGQPRTDH
ncbi:MAG TPA: four helix bundle protein [Flavobacteriales bacterium]|nr:four helix bundle protein [Flavobacteriales bacterium]HMR28835.1 four helix bundle protein [Flavobacteriales bacterium]